MPESSTLRVVQLFISRLSWIQDPWPRVIHRYHCSSEAVLLVSCLCRGLTSTCALKEQWRKWASDWTNQTDQQQSGPTPSSQEVDAPGKDALWNNNPPTAYSVYHANSRLSDATFQSLVDGDWKPLLQALLPSIKETIVAWGYPVPSKIAEAYKLIYGQDMISDVLNLRRQEGGDAAECAAAVNNCTTVAELFDTWEQFIIPFEKTHANKKWWSILGINHPWKSVLGSRVFDAVSGNCDQVGEYEQLCSGAGSLCALHNAITKAAEIAHDYQGRASNFIQPTVNEIRQSIIAH